MPVFARPDFGAIAVKMKKKDIPEGLWTKCDSCGEVLFNKELHENQMVCRACGHHFNIPAHERLSFLLDPESFEEHDTTLEPVDVLKFTGATSYVERLKTYQKKTKLKDAVVSGLGKIEGARVSVAVMDFNFLAATMGSVVGEKITRAIERGTKLKIPVIVVCASGGARMHEGMFSLMQMAKTSAALSRHAQKGLPYISVLTNPTMAGVMASFATLGDLIIAEPRAMIGFAGARVIKGTTLADLPKGFQTSEFLLDHGLIDMIVPRQQMRTTLHRVLGYLGKKG